MGVMLGRPPGPGPVFEFEWVTASRRWQAYASRSLFVSVLLAALTLTWTNTTNRTIPSTLRVLAEIGGQFYAAVIGTELTLVLLAAPAATAGAICIDRARGTLTHLLVTDLTDAEIVLGKAAARLVPVLGLVVCGLPVLALLVLLGGVDPDALLGAFMVTIGVALLGCSLALVFSLWAGKTHEALLGTYAVWALWLLSRPMLVALGVPVGGIPWISDPFYLVLAPYWWPGQVGWLDYLTFLGATSAISAALVALAILSLRRVCTRQNVKKPRRWSRHFPAFAALGGRLAPLRFSIGPPLDFNPVLWREWHRNRPSRWSRVIGTLFITLATTFSIVAILSGQFITAMLVNGFQVSIGLLLLSVSAATSLAEERVRGSLDVLMATPLSTRQIVMGKWLGSFRLVPLLAVLPALVIMLTGNNPVFPNWIGAVVMTAYILACGAAVTSLGLAMATWCSRLGRAVGFTVTGFVLITVGWLFLVVALFQPNPLGWILITASPFYGALLTTAESCSGQFGGPDTNLTGPVLWTVLYSGLSVILLVATLLSFNRCLGRVEEFLPFGDHWTPEPVELLRVETVVGPEFAQR